MENNIKQPEFIGVPKIIMEQPDFACECGNTTFKELLKVKKISALISPNGRESYVPYEILVCNKCEKQIEV